LAEQEIEREPDDEYNNDDTDSQESLCEILRDGGKGERAGYQDDWEAELHEKKPSKVREYGKTGMMQQKQLDVEERHRDEDKDEEQLGKEKLPPKVRLGDPPLSIANESLALDHPENEEDPRKGQEKGDVATGKSEEER